MSLELYRIKQIEYKTAMKIVVDKHYLHRKCPCSIAFGLFYKNDIVGTIIYGTPSSAPLRKGIAGEKNSRNVIELTRLWVSDDVCKNGESFLIGNTIKKCGKEIIVSFAEIEQGHVGIVYQATNFLYTGLSAKRTNWTVQGHSLHCQTLADKFTSKEIREKFGDQFSLVDRPRKHRYIYINASHKRKKELLSQLKYKILPYPKIDGTKNSR